MIGKKRLKRRVLCAPLLVILLLTPTGAKKESEKKVKFEMVTFVTSPEAKMVLFFKEGKISKATVKGRFTASTEEGVLKADKGEYDNEKKKIFAEGNILFYDERNRGTAQKAEVDLDERKVTLEGEVKLFISPKRKEEKRAEKEEKAEPAVVTCPKIIYWYREKRAKAEGKVLLEQEQVREGKKRITRITADKAEYRTEKQKQSGEEVELVVLEENVRFEDSEGQYLLCQRLVYSLTEEKLEVEGVIEARFKIEEEEEKQAPEEKEGGEAGG